MAPRQRSCARPIEAQMGLDACPDVDARRRGGLQRSSFFTATGEAVEWCVCAIRVTSKPPIRPLPPPRAEIWPRSQPSPTKFSVGHFGRRGRRALVEKTGIWRLDRPQASQPKEWWPMRAKFNGLPVVSLAERIGVWALRLLIWAR
jgi:hypothetical protein